MKKIILHILILIVSLSIVACEKPLPTQLAPDDNSDQGEIEIQPITQDDEFIYSSGYDSTGIETAIPKVSSLISVSAVKATYGSRTVKIGIAEAFFFDRSMSVWHPGGGGRLMGFKTRNIGLVSFENIPARIMPFMVHYRDKGMVRDTVLGQYNLLYKYNNSGDPFTFTHDSNINFKLKTMMNRTEEFEIPTPKEIIAQVEASGALSTKDLSFKVKWNESKQGDVEIVIGGVAQGSTSVVPLTNIHVKDNGTFKVPSSLLKGFPLDQFDRIVFTLTRKKVTQYQPTSVLKDNTIVAQTIHSIQLDIPK